MLSAIIYFLDGSEDPVIEVVRTAGADGDITIAQLEAGYEFTGIPATVTQVYVVGNYNSSNANGAAATFPMTRGQFYSQIQAVQLEIQQVAYPRLSDGTVPAPIQLLAIMDGRSMVQSYAGMPNGWNGEADLTDDDLYADITIYPMNARLEIVEITYTGTVLESFTLEGIYINNYFDLMPVSLDPMMGAGYSPVNHGSNEDLYDVDSNSFAYTNLSTLYDVVDEDVTVTGGTATITPDNGTWAYHLFGNSSPAPHIILKLTDLVYANGTTLPTRYVTVKGYRENGVDVGIFYPHVIYKLTDLAFGDSDLSPVPEPENINLWVHVQVQPWETIDVTPVI